METGDKVDLTPSYSPCPMPYALCPMPHAPCPIPH
ncbi:histidine kinase [Nostoc sp. CMAA1605]|nr:histidine kinase [Nostoc sp. CMAA1605]